MAPPPKNPNMWAYLLCLILLVSITTLSAALSTSYSSLCPSPSPAADKHTDVDDALSLIRSFQISTGYFSGGGGGLFSPDDDDIYNSRSVSLFPHGVSRTSDPNILHLTATLTLQGPGGSRTYHGSFSRRHRYSSFQTVSFVLDGYYSSTSFELCMVGTGTELADDGSLKRYEGVALRLRVPTPPKLTDPFVTGRLDVSGFKAINLVAYTEGDNYKYGERAPACSPPMPPAGTARGSLQALGANFSCALLKQQLTSSYRLEHDGGADAPSRTSKLLRRMHVSQMQCTTDGAVRAYVVFSSNGTDESSYRYRHHQQSRMLLDNEAVVAEGHWDSARSMLCLRACRVVRRPWPYTPAVQHECGIQMSFWFPAVWTMRDRSVAAGMIWSSRQGSTGSGTGSNDAGLISGVMSAWSIELDNVISMGNSYRSNLSDVKYRYTDMVIEEAKQHHLKIKKQQEKMKESSFLAPGNLTYEDLNLRFFASPGGSGHAYPIAIGMAMVHGDRLAADVTLSRHPVVDMVTDGLLNVSYAIDYNAPPDNWVPSKNGSDSYTTKIRRISAEGVYDTTRGILCMVGCWQRNSSSPTDCQILVTMQLPSLDRTTRGQGAISSLRNKADPLFFERISIDLFGMYSYQMAEAVSRMDLESILLVVSTTLSCVFTALQILHTKKKPEAATATSITMLTILASGHLASLVLSTEALFGSRRRQYYGFSFLGNGWASLELNTVMLRVPTLIAFVLQLRLLQLAWSGRRSADQSKASAAAVAERRVLQICVPLYVLGGVLAGIVHEVHAHAAAETPLVIPGETAATLWEDIVSYLGLVLDGFLLPQIVLNAAWGSRVRAISPWFYVGVTVLRAMPHAYDVVRSRGYVQSMRPSYIYASHRGDLFGVAWNVIIPCAVAVLALLLFMQQRVRPERRRSGGYEMVPGL